MASSTSQAGGQEEEAARGPLAAPELLHGQLEPIHAASAGIAALGLLPAIQVAWADGVIQEAERALIL